ncbi:aminotransferase-like domain-containing protein [Phenylobacterium montanum]|uniref:PLP-dependent aminotransferase family protein n=1 Tax=Phenylobacterium montanum TaxID=2823693 RepID=A0A975IUZ7_9CAUL|nr:PLP-dependent aminotransferase family protein [Caulobacter sp. S6]QUD88323.1 PLP-dependent aminotransferase family protein [Caulobacter sp. S6]
MNALSSSEHIADAIDWAAAFSSYGRRATASEIRELLKLLDQPGIISFAGGIPDPALFPLEILAEAHARVFADPALAQAALQYSVSEGYRPLRDRLAQTWRDQGVELDADNILITNGSQQALDLIGRLFLDPGDVVLSARPTYLGALQAFNAAAPRHGDLADLATGPKAKLAYVMPDFANPTGETMGMNQRSALLADAEARGVTVVEDGAYVSLSYDGEPPPSLLALEAAAKGSVDPGRVIHCGTFSKTIVPGLRVGWIVAPRPVIRKLVLLKQAADLHTSSLAQIVLADVLDHLGPGHIQALRAAYGERRDAMLAALDRHMPPGVSWSRPKGGMFVWVDLPEGQDGAALLQRAIETERVAFVPGGAFFATEPRRNSLRLAFSLSDPATIEEGVARLGRLLRSEAAR